jgi:hypothetical protein
MDMVEERYAMNQAADVIRKVYYSNGSGVPFTPQIPANIESAADALLKLDEIQVFILAFND